MRVVIAMSRLRPIILIVAAILLVIGCADRLENDKERTAGADEATVEEPAIADRPDSAADGNEAAVEAPGDAVRPDPAERASALAGEIEEITVRAAPSADRRSMEEILRLQEASRQRASQERVVRQYNQIGIMSPSAAPDVTVSRSSAFANPQYLGLVTRPDLQLPAGAATGEELWIIATPAADAASTSRDDSSPGSGAMVAYLVSPDEDAPVQTREVPLPLKHTAVSARIDGYVGSVDVVQQFENPFGEKIEAVYLFPLPEKSAVSEFVMVIGERRIRGILREKEEAEEIYYQARAAGYQASLMTQHRPNIFEQKVANIEPGKAIDVEIRYFHTLAYQDGWYSFVFPTVVGPRYNPPDSTDPVLALPRGDEPASAGVTYLRPNERSGHDLSIEVELDAGVRIEELAASHEIVETRQGDESALIALADQRTLPNRDFVLRFRVAGGTVKSNLLTHVDPESGQGYFTLMMYPPASLTDLRRQPMEMVFVLDCSGSMNGRPLEQAKQAVRAALDELRPDDTFQIIRFSVSASQFGTEPVPATPGNLKTARRYLDGLNGQGGTQMIEGIRAALDFPHDPSRLRFVSFMTDGYIGNEVQIIGEVHKRLGESRIFSFGVGSSVNRFLLERLAGVGRGAVAFLGPDDHAGEIMNYFFERISHPALTDIGIDWGSMDVSDLYPARIPDMFVGRPLVITGKFAGETAGLLVTGTAGGTEQRFMIAAAGTAEHEFIPRLWARHRIADLSDRQAWTQDPQDELGTAIRDTALRYDLMSAYTAFIAVDASTITEGDHGVTVRQAVPVPEGVRYETTVNRN